MLLLREAKSSLIRRVVRPVPDSRAAWTRVHPLVRPSGVLLSYCGEKLGRLLDETMAFDWLEMELVVISGRAIWHERRTHLTWLMHGLEVTTRP